MVSVNRDKGACLVISHRLVFLLIETWELV